MYGKQMNMADFSIVGQTYQFELIGTIKYDHINSTDIILKLFNDFQIFTAFTGGSAGSFLGLILLKIVIFRQLNDFNEPKSIIQQ